MTALKSNSNAVWFNFQTYIYIYIHIYIYMKTYNKPSNKKKRGNTITLYLEYIL
jgi:hypothetical protein